MGFGGYLTWTAVAREIRQKKDYSGYKAFPFERMSDGSKKRVFHEIFKNNPDFIQEGEECKTFPLQLNNPETNYCKKDTPTYTIHRTDKHVIAQICEYYGIEDPKLKCELYLTEEENKKAAKLLEGAKQEFVVIEPYSKANYTPNRQYSFEKWQKIVDEISKYIQVVQIGFKDNEAINNVADYT